MYFLLGIALVSAAGLAFEITLTRLFAISQGYHFGFLAVSLALLGFGASGAFLALRSLVTQDTIPPRLAQFSFGFSICLIASYLAINYLPFDSYRIAWEPIQLLFLLLYYLALVAPFFLVGLVLGLPLVALPADQSARVYAANLVGSGLGCLVALSAVTVFDGTGAVILAALLGALGALAFSIHAPGKRAIYLATGLILAWGALLVARPAVFDLRISPYKSLSQLMRLPDARLVSKTWNAYSQIQVVESSTVHSVPGLSLTYRGAMPTQRALFVDGESINPLTNDAPRDLLNLLPITLAYELRPNARALILEPGGGLEVLAALNAGAGEIIVVENNPLVARAAHEYAPRVFGDPRVRLVVESARGYLARSRERFDVVHLALGDSFHPVTAGAYALSENYLYTREAFANYLDHLDAEGILVVSRWLQLPPAEEARTAALAIAVLDRDAPESHLLALRSFSTMLLLVKRTPFTAREIESARGFAQQCQFDWIAYPGIHGDETNRFNVLRENEYARVFQQLLDPIQRAQLFATHIYDITPTTDDRPFFLHFFKWEQAPQIVQLLGKMWQPFGGSGFLILIALLALSIGASGVLILLPLSLRAPPVQMIPHHRQRKELLYFACLGIGFLFVEIPLIQRFVLFLDQPVYAFATVLFTLLIASGVGSFFSPRLPLRAMLVALIASVLVSPMLLPLAFRFLIGETLIIRMIVSFILLAPLGFLMGIPFPKGLARLHDTTPSLIPLAWGINGCASVISSILATMGAMSFGFSAMVLAGALAYALALFFVPQRMATICRASAERKLLP